MQHEMMRQPAPVPGSEKVGDVLASIRRLIAQDEAASTIPNQMLNTLPRDSNAEPDGVAAETAPAEPATPVMVAWARDAAPQMPTAEEATAEPLPLVLNTSDLIAPGFPEVVPDMAAEAAPAAVTATATGTEIEMEIEIAAEPETDQAAPLAAADIEPEPVAETLAEATAEAAPDPVPDLLPDTISPGEPLGASLAAAPRPDFDLDALWADLTEPQGPATAPEDTDSAASGSAELPENDTASHSLNLMQPEENMLQANASVTPINPHIDAGLHAETELLRDGGEPHLFAPQDKGAQKGTHLRGMIREAIRQELQGEIGNRLSRNLQQMIRHEIELTLRQMCEQE